jgi:hypothetical protein
MPQASSVAPIPVALITTSGIVIPPFAANTHQFIGANLQYHRFVIYVSV